MRVTLYTHQGRPLLDGKNGNVHKTVDVNLIIRRYCNTTYVSTVVPVHVHANVDGRVESYTTFVREDVL